MSKRKRSQDSVGRRGRNGDSRDVFEETEYEDQQEIVFLPNADDSGESKDGDTDTDELEFPNISYRTVLENYSESQKLLEPDHNYEWIGGEKIISGNLDDQLLLLNGTKSKIRNSTPVQLFE